MRIAIIGTGIAGLGAAHVLARAHDVGVFERQARPGGHSNTIATPTPDGRTLPLDTGFLVHNVPNYPNLLKLFAELGVRTQDSDMSFSVSCRRCGIEYSGSRPFAQPTNALRPSFLRMLRDTTRYLRTAKRDLDEGRLEGRTLAEYVRDGGYSREFQDHFLVPLTAALWSASPGQTLGFPIAHAVRFYDHHRMLGFGRDRWRTVTGGSRTYVDAIVERLGERVRLGAGVTALARDADGVDVTTADGRSHRFDAAVVATHPDEALGFLVDATDDERAILGAFPYNRNDTVLHTDERFLPRRKAARASWNYHLDDCRAAGEGATLTYSLNRLQALDEPLEYCVTLNRTGEVSEQSVIERIVYEHPHFTLDGVRRQAEIPRIQGVRRTWYCGAWQGWGFHEDGLASALRVTEALGVRW